MRDAKVKDLEAMRAMHVSQIDQARQEFPYLETPPDIYSEVYLFRTTHFMDTGSAEEVQQLAPEDRKRYDDLMEYATTVAFADVSGILNRDEIDKAIKGERERIQITVLGRRII